MASLYIKDPEAKRLAERLGAARGLTRTAAVKLALAHELARDDPPVSARDDVRSVLERFWKDNRLGEPTGLEADKAFYDRLNDENEG